MQQHQLSLAQVRELYGRFFACALAELEANFLLHDFSHWHHRHEAICKQLADICAFDAREALSLRIGALGLLTNAEQEDLTEQICITWEVCCESRARIETEGKEVEYLQQHNLTPTDYLQDLRSHPDAGLILIPHH
jgi:hypothetical protein